MRSFSTSILLLAMSGLGSLAGPAAADGSRDFTLNPTYCSPACGASQAGASWTRPSQTPIYEQQTLSFSVDAYDLVQAGDEIVFASIFAGDLPFTPPGQFTPNATGGGIGVILGSAYTQFHPACSNAGPNSLNRQFGILGYTWANPYGSSAGIVSCKNVALADLTGRVHVSFTSTCVANVCSATATLTRVPQNTVLATASASGVRITNPTNARKTWYAVSNFTTAPNFPVLFTSPFESYTAPVNNPPGGGCNPRPGTSCP